MAVTGSGEAATFREQSIIIRATNLDNPAEDNDGLVTIILRNISTTAFVPQTTHDARTTSNFTTGTTTPLYSYGDLREEVTQPVQVSLVEGQARNAKDDLTTFHALDGAGVSVTTTTVVPPPSGNTNVLTIVGATCGIVGLLLGIIITAAIWMYVQKRRNANRPYRHASVVEKNPKEMTFEPLDLTLTLPSYGQGEGSAEKRTSLTGSVRTNQSTPKRHTPSEPNPSSYHSYDEPTPPLPPSNHEAFDQDFVGAFGRPRELLPMGSDYSYINDRFCAHEDFSGSFSDVSAPHRRSDRYRKSRNSSKEHAVRLSSITTRDSFSSGLGTGTESDTLPYESRTGGHRFSLRKESLDEHPMHRNGETPPHNQLHYPSARHQDMAPTRISGLGIVREDSARRSKRSGMNGNRRRVPRVSDASSSYAPSRTPSVNDWSTDGSSSYSPSSTLPPQPDLDPVFQSPTSEGVINEEDLGSVPPVSRGESPGSGVNGDDEEVEDIVSTYFDMHFPPTPLRSNTLSSKHSLRDSQRSSKDGLDAPETKERVTRPVTLIRQNSDVTIDL